MPRVKLFNEEIALRQALELFWAQGYEATSLSDLTRTLNIGKGSFYDTFGSKRKLFERCLHLYQRSSFEMVDQILSQQSDPIKIIRHLLYNHAEMMLNNLTPKGCFFANSTAELADDQQVKDFLITHDKIMKGKLKAFLGNSVYAKKADELIDLLLTHMTGISVMSKIVKDPKRFQLSNDLFMKVFED